jgi:ABC-type lipoprotein export system ATPase subunit
MVTHDPAVAERAPRQITVKDGVIAADIRRLPDPALCVTPQTYSAAS